MNEELREKIAKLLFGNIWKWEICMEVSDKILILIREAGWRSPEEITIECPQCHREGFLSDYIIYKFDKDKQPQ